MKFGHSAKGVHEGANDDLKEEKWLQEFLSGDIKSTKRNNWVDDINTDEQ